jgi:putative oxidoreductase
MQKFLQLEFLPKSVDAGLLLLRVWMGGVLFLKHGLDKVNNYSTMVQHFPDPLHLGMHFSINFALFSDVVCSLLVVFGVATRLAALIPIISMTVVFCVVNRFALFPQRNGELSLLFLGAFLVILVAGPGRFSIDYMLAKRA